MGGMISQKPLATCPYGWGRSLKLYQEYLDVDGMLYALHTLMHMRVYYRRVMNISSVRLELQFQARSLVLRGISGNDVAEQVVSHLKSYCPGAIIDSAPSRKGRVKLVSNEQSDKEVREQHQELMKCEPAIAAETPRWLLDLAQDMQRMQTRNARKANSLDGRGDDVDPDREQLAQHLQADTLPSLTIPIPLRLAPGEQARYSIEATLSAEPLSDGSNESPSYTYPPKDQGTLILTNRRLIYMGRRGQRVLGYARILRVSRLRGAIALLTDITEQTGVIGQTDAMNHVPTWGGQRTHREIFQVSRPLECALYLDHLLRQFYVQVATQHLAPEAMSNMGKMEDKHIAQDDERRQQQWSLSNRATEKVVVTRTGINGITEGIDVHSIQRSLAEIADLTEIETCPLTAVRRVRV